MSAERGVLPERYVDARLIGRGGMGEIYGAQDRELGRQVAIKLLDERFAGDPQLRLRFKREALTAARLSGHPHVVTIFDVGEHDSRPFIVMEYLSGGTLADRARAGPIGHADALAWLTQAAEALDGAHQLGIVHRDVKPANLLFDARGSLVVADFGIARIADDTTGMTASGMVLGTAGYLAPEQALGESASPASDRYALAVVAYELLTGGRPFERGSATAEAAAHIHEPVPPASERGVALSPAIDPVFDRALAKNPAERYPTAAAFVRDLEAALSPADEPTRVLPVPAAAPARRGPGPVADRRRSVLSLPVVAAILALALAGGVAAAVFATGGDEGRRAAISQQKPVTVTKRQTKTLEGETVVRTVVTTVETTPTTVPPPADGAVSIEDAVRLTDEATFALRRGDWSEAEALARRAYRALKGTYSDEFRYEAYVNFNLGKALAELGRCEPALRYLDRSEDLQGHRSEIDEARARCESAE